MAKDRHKIFEIYPTRDEAAWELMPKASNVGKVEAASDTWTFEQLIVERLVGITHVRFKEAELLATEIVTQIQTELIQLADKLGGNGRVLIDFTGVESFDTAGINALVAFDKRLRVRGSRMVLCCLDTNVRTAFFGAP